MQDEELANAMHVLLLHLQSSTPEQKPLVSVLLLHLDLLVCPFSILISLFLILLCYILFPSLAETTV